MAVVALVEHQSAERRLAEMHRLFNHRLEHWLQVARRSIDDLQDLGDRLLLLQ